MMRKVKVASPEMSNEIDDALGLQAISIRLDKELIEKFKLVAKIKGIIYQPLMREALKIFIDHEITNILRGVTEDVKPKRIQSKPSTDTEKS